MAKYVSDKTKIGHAQGAHRYVRRDEDLIVEWWRVANVTKYTLCAIPKDEAREYCIQAVKYLEMMCSLDYVYKSSTNRWQAYTMIEKYKKAHPLVSTDEAIILCSGKGYGIDCSALVLACLYWAGFPFKGTWRTYTGGLKTVLRKSGLYDIYEDTLHCSTDRYAKAGALYWKVNPSGGQGHVVMSINDYDEEPEPEPPTPPEPTGKTYLEMIKGSLKIRSGGSTAYKQIGVARKGDIYEVIGRADSGWYQINMGNALVGYISDKYPNNVRVYTDE